MNRPLRVLIVEDSEDHTILLLHELKRGGFDPTFERVETAEAMKAALHRQTWDLILSDNDLPHFSIRGALSLLKETGLDLPFIIVTGHMSEEAAVAAIKGGAHDYVMKTNLPRLIPAIQRELQAAEVRRERRRAEEALKESEKRFRLLVEHSPDVIMTVDRESKILFINYTLPQYTIENVLGKTAVSFLSAEDGLRYRQSLHEVFDTGESREFELSAVGPTFWLTRLIPIKSDGRIESAMVIATNITERKRVEETLQKIVTGTASVTGERFFPEVVRHLAAALGVRVAIVTEQVDDQPVRLRTLSIWMSDRWGEPFEYDIAKTPCERVMKQGKMCYYPDRVQEIFPEDRDLVAMGVTSYMGMPLIGASGAPIGHLCVLHNGPIADEQRAKTILSIFAARAAAELNRTRAEEALQKSEEDYRKILTNINEVVYNVAMDEGQVTGAVQFVSSRTEDIIGYRPDEFIEDSGLWFRIVHPEDKEILFETTRKIIESQTAGVREYRIRHKETGEYLIFEDRVVPQVGESGKVIGIFGVARDVTERKRTEERLKTSEALLTEAQRVAQIGNWNWDITTNVVTWSDELYRMFGLRPQEIPITFERFLSYVHPEDRDEVNDVAQKALKNHQPFDHDRRIIWPDGTVRIQESRGAVEIDSAGHPIRMYGTVQDITERKQAEEALRKSEARHRALLNAMPDMMFRINREGVYLEFIAAKDMDPLLPPHEFLGKNIMNTLPANVARQAMHYVIQALETGHTQIFEYELLLKGNRHDYEARIVVSGTDEVMAIVRDITDRKSQAAALEYQALHDILTDLPNRTLVMDRLKQAIHAADRENQPLALMIMDLNHFKDVNDALGHHHGDLLLKQVGPRVLGVLRESDTIARMGGDEFAILLSATEINGAIVAAQKVLEVLERPFVVEGFFLEIGASIGIAVFPEHGEDTDMLMRRADVAMYQAKQSGSGYAVYISEDDRHSPRRLALMGELRHAVERQELVLYYQPKIDLKAGRTIGVEALVRWNHPHHGLIPPDQFISLAEHTGVIKPLTLWVLREAAHQALAWHQTGMDIPVAVNLSVRNLQDLQLPDQIAELLRANSGMSDWLELEITESAIMADPGRAMGILKRLRALGIRFSIDDFGVGYSSLSYLRKMPVDTVKVDKSFVIGMAASEDDAVIVRSTVDLAHNLGLQVVAEGVESREILDRLVTMGCDEAQGYFISRPVPAADLTRWLAESPWGFKEA